MDILNPRLFELLTQAFGQVEVVNQGQEMVVWYEPHYLGRRPGGLHARIAQWGESYKVSCPFCSDTRKRLSISHRWAIHDEKTGDDNLHLATCFNEGCTSTGEQQRKLHAMVYPLGMWARHVKLPPKPTPTPPPPPPPIVLPASVPLADLEAGHPAREYLTGRGFDPDRLARDYDPLYCEGDRTSRPMLTDPRIIIPLYRLEYSVLSPAEEKVVLAGWQARAINPDLPDGCAKYYTATGTRKSALLYGLPTAVKTKGPAVIVEGACDAWAVGPSAVAILGKAISAVQCQLVNKYFHGRPVVVWLDADADKEAEAVQKAILRACGAIRGAPVLLARCPAGRHDPGECTAAEVRAAIDKAMSGKSRRK